MIQVYYNNVLHNVNYYYEIEYSILHRDGDEPAEIYVDGSKCWHKNGQSHREGDLPAIIHASGSKFWYKNGQLHREGDEPAIIHIDGSKFWYKNGKLYARFNFSYLISIQLFLIFLFNNLKNRPIFHPDNLVGKLIKLDLEKMISKISYN